MKRGIRLLIPLFILMLAASAGPVTAADMFVKDVDHDGFPDDLEIKTKNDPKVNEALKKSTAGGKCGVIKTDLLKIGAAQNVLLIVDVSGSMNEAMSGSTRMEIAKRIMTKYVDALPASMKAGLMTYGNADCGDESIQLLVPLAQYNHDALKAQIAALEPRGSTPIALAIAKAMEFLKGLERENNSMIIVSDGQESCGGDPIKAITDLRESGASPEVTVIGLGVDANTRKQLAKIAASSEGVYEDVKTEEDLVKAFGNFFKKLSGMYKDIVCIVRQYNVYLSNETDQFNTSKNYILKASTMSKDDTLTAALKNVQARIEQNHADRVAAQNKLNEMIKNKLDEMELSTKAFIGTK